MKIVFFVHSLISDWNHGNAHFLRGVVRNLQELEHEVEVFEPVDGWSKQQLIQEQGKSAIKDFQEFFPTLHSTSYSLKELDLDRALDGADLVIAHEWNEPELISRLGEHRRRKDSRYRLLFHDTHHRAVSAPEEMRQYDLANFDGVLVFGESLCRTYRKNGWSKYCFVWHEAADTTIFRPQPTDGREGVVWVGNWGDGERSEELKHFFLEPIEELDIPTDIYGVRFPAPIKQRLHSRPFSFHGWIANHRAPAVFSSHRATLHIPRRFYRDNLPGIPTIRVFEALACGIPLICSPWEDSEGLFRPGTDYLIVKDGREMKEALEAVLNDDRLSSSLSENGLETIRRRHTCKHRALELLRIARALGVYPSPDKQATYPALSVVATVQ